MSSNYDWTVRSVSNFVTRITIGFCRLVGSYKILSDLVLDWLTWAFIVQRNLKNTNKNYSFYEYLLLDSLLNSIDKSCLLDKGNSTYEHIQSYTTVAYDSRLRWTYTLVVFERMALYTFIVHDSRIRRPFLDVFRRIWPFTIVLFRPGKVGGSLKTLSIVRYSRPKNLINRELWA